MGHHFRALIGVEHARQPSGGRGIVHVHYASRHTGRQAFSQQTGEEEDKKQREDDRTEYVNMVLPQNLTLPQSDVYYFP